jgi:hypothetical protein
VLGAGAKYEQRLGSLAALQLRQRMRRGFNRADLGVMIAPLDAPLGSFDIYLRRILDSNHRFNFPAGGRQ